MLGCLLAALLAGPVGLWTEPRANPSGSSSRRVNGRRMVLLLSATALIALCAAMLLLLWFQPAPFRHICSVLARP